MRVLIANMPHFARIIKSYFKNSHSIVEVDNIPSDNPIRILVKLGSFDIIHFLYSPTVKLRGMFVLPMLKMLKKKVIIQWAGSDILQLYISHKSKMTTALTMKLAVHLCTSSWNQRELSQFGIKANLIKSEVVGLNVSTNVPSLPHNFTVLAYLPKSRFNFYGGGIIEKLIEEYPSITFIIVGDDGEGRIKAKNVKWLGYIPFKKMSDIYKRTTVLIRMPEHDGLSNMVIEALIHGRYVIYNYRFPYCCHARNYEEVKSWINVLRKIKEPNLSGRNYAIKFIEHHRAKLEHMYKAICRGG